MNSGEQMVGAHRLYEKLGFERMPDREGTITEGGRTIRLLSFTIPVAARPASSELEERQASWSTTDTDVVIIGGGAMGSATAWQLAARGTRVTLLERHSPGHAFGASHGASRNFNVSYADPVHLALLTESLRLWRELGGRDGCRTPHPGGHRETTATTPTSTACTRHSPRSASRASSCRPRKRASAGPASGSPPGYCTPRRPGD